jgi:hypothetical protein
LFFGRVGTFLCKPAFTVPGYERQKGHRITLAVTGYYGVLEKVYCLSVNISSKKTPQGD